METLKKLSPLHVAGAIVVVGAIIYLAVYRGGEKAASPAPEGGTVATGETQASGTAPDASVPTAPKKTTPPTSPSAKAVSSINILTPREGDTWAIGALHEIAWNKEPFIPGGVALLDAVTEKMLGWILPVTGIQQLSFSWDTRDVSITRAGGAKQNLAPGTYRLLFTFNDVQPNVISAPFTVVERGAAETITTAIRFKDEKITPSVLMVARGAKVVFVNSDAVVHTITSVQGFGIFTLNPGASHLLDTSTLASGTYYFASSVYSFRASGTLVIK